MEKIEVCLMNTEQCNLNCSYCYRDKSFNRRMTLDVACKHIDDVISEYSESTTITFLFMAGEPFMAFDIIKGCVAYVKDKYFYRKNIRFKAVSNATLIHGEIQEWLLNNREVFEVTISLDGQENTQTTNRGVSFDKIDLNFFKTNFKGLNVSSVLTPENLSTFAEDVMYMESMGFYIKCSIADGICWEDDKYKQEFAFQLKKIADYYLSNPHIYPMKMFNIGLYSLLSNKSLKRCAPGITSFAIAVDGKRYPCHRCTPFYNNGKWQIPDEYISLKNVRYIDDRCQQCIVRKICSPCPATVAALRNKKDASAIRCVMNKILFAANAYLQSMIVLKCPSHVFLKNKTTEQQKEIIKASKMILSNLDVSHPF